MAFTSVGTHTCQDKARATASAISESLRLWMPFGLISISSATALTPGVRLAASSAAAFSANMGTLPLSVTTPSLTATPMSVSLTRRVPLQMFVNVVLNLCIASHDILLLKIGRAMPARCL